MVARRNSTYRQGIVKKKFRRGQTCYWCSRPIEQHTATIDHVIPLSRGGSNAASNCVLTCYDCNQERGNRDVFAEIAADLNQQKSV